MFPLAPRIHLPTIPPHQLRPLHHHPSSNILSPYSHTHRQAKILTRSRQQRPTSAPPPPLEWSKIFDFSSVLLCYAMLFLAHDRDRDRDRDYPIYSISPRPPSDALHPIPSHYLQRMHHRLILSPSTNIPTRPPSRSDRARVGQLEGDNGVAADDLFDWEGEGARGD